jgi:hypothetical protein
VSDELPRRVAGASLPPAALHAAGSAASALADELWRRDEQALRVLLDGLRPGGGEGEESEPAAGG